MNHKKVELLAPAGGMEQLKAAVENGADAVYIGGRKFNARMNAGNFTTEEMKDAIIYAGSRDVRIFVAINILLKDEELKEAVEYIAELYEIGIDGVILQDIGLASLVRKYVPDMEMHFSTQGSVYNRSGVANALKAGFKRVVLAREMSLEEIKECTELCDTEVFVHGAMCMCYSGQCQMSRMMGGRSGNRGMCAQPCRLPYEDDKGNKSYLLSPKDMCTIDMLGDLIEAGVASLKIEGRMKSPEYVATVVRIYRKYIDEYYRNGSYTVAPEDREDLEQIYNRGAFTTGYLKKNPGDRILSGALSKHQGIYAGKVVRNRDHDLVEIRLEEGMTLENGDAVEIRSRELMGNVITYVKKVSDKNRTSGRLIIGDIKGRPEPGDRIYKTRSRKLMERAAADSAEYSRKKEIGAVFTGIENEYPSLCLYTENTEINITGKIKVEKAIKRPLEQERIEEQLKKTGNTPFEISYICCVFPYDCTIPVKEINRMRREGIELLMKKTAEGNNPPDLTGLDNEFYYISDKNVYKDEKSEKEFLPDRNVLLQWTDGKKHSDENVKVFSSVTKGKEDEVIENLLKENLHGTKVVLNNIGWIEEFRRAGAEVYAGPGMNVSNYIWVKELERMGVKVAAWSFETEENAEILMVTEHPLKTEYIRDRKGKTYNVVKSVYGDKFYIMNK